MRYRWSFAIVIWGTAASAPAAERRVVDERALRLQLRLDEAHFSPGEIDGVAGPMTRRASAAQAATSCPSGAAARVPADDSRPVLVGYTLTEADVAGPFADIPEDMMEKAALPALGYSSVVEALAERFHASPALLQRLNPGVRFEPGVEIRVPNVQRPPLSGVAARVVVDASERAVLVVDKQDCVLARYPATLGGENDPLPMGTWKVTDTLLDPVFHYNPDLFWDADPTHAKAKLPKGPNNPVGVVWIGLSKEHYGIHGTPEPASVGKTQSHGCIRLTNWDALELSKVVKTGMPVVLQE